MCGNLLAAKGFFKTFHGRINRQALKLNGRGVAQFGSAGALGALGRRFESCRPDLVLAILDLRRGAQGEILT